MADYLKTEFVNTQAGEPIRLFPFGTLVKNGKERQITPELAHRFRLPHYKPAIKLGSHDDVTPAGGHIVSLEVREDGLYGIPEVNDQGAAALQQGNYRYVSPEVIWENGYLEDPATGNPIEGPLIVGLAMLHDPHLGEAAALYSTIEQQNSNREVKHMDENTVQVPKNLWDKFVAWFDRETEPAPETPPEPAQAEELNAIAQERDEYKAELARLQAEREQADHLAAVRGELETEEFGAAYHALADVPQAVEMLAGMNAEQRGWVLGQLKALSAQINESRLTGEIGSSGEGLPAGAGALEKLNATIIATQQEKQVDYNAAMRIVREQHPDLVAAAYEGA